MKVVTWNVRTARGLDGRVDLERVASVLAPIDAEIIALQELDVGRERTFGVDQPAWLRARLGMQLVFCSAVQHRDGQYGHALFVRAAPRRARVVLLPRLPLRERRGLIVADVETPLGSIQVMSAHLGLLELERIRQARAIERLARAAGLPVVLLGDLNAGARAPSMRILRRVFQDAGATAASPTWPARFPWRRLDYVLLRGLASRGARTLDEGAARLASDHLPVVAEMRRHHSPPSTGA